MNILKHENAASAQTFRRRRSYLRCRSREPSIRRFRPRRSEPALAGMLAWRRHQGKGVFPALVASMRLYPRRARASKPSRCSSSRMGGSTPATSSAPLPCSMRSSLRSHPAHGRGFRPAGDLPDNPERSRGNRSVEYDTLGDAYVRFLIDELLPEALAGLNVQPIPASAPLRDEFGRHLRLQRRLERPIPSAR